MSLARKPRRAKHLPVTRTQTTGKHRLYISLAVYQRYRALQLYKPHLMPDPAQVLEKYMDQKARRVERGLAKSGQALPDEFREHAKRSRTRRDPLYKTDLLLKRVSECEPTGLSISGMIRATGWNYRTVRKYRDALVANGRLRHDPDGMHHLAERVDAPIKATKVRMLTPKQIEQYGFAALSDKHGIDFYKNWKQQPNAYCHACNARQLEIVGGHVECGNCKMTYLIRDSRDD